jgi:PPOX class probable F420-dependent enzyme
MASRQLTDAQLELLRGKNFAAVTTLRADGSPQTSIVWIDTDGERVIFNSTTWRAKTRDLRRDPRVSVLVLDANDPYRYFVVEGEAELDLEGADAHIHELSRRFRGKEFHAPHDRVIVRVNARRIYDYRDD